MVCLPRSLYAADLPGLEIQSGPQRVEQAGLARARRPGEHRQLASQQRAQRLDVLARGGTGAQHLIANPAVALKGVLHLRLQEVALVGDDHDRDEGRLTGNQVAIQHQGIGLGVVVRKHHQHLVRVGDDHLFRPPRQAGARGLAREHAGARRHGLDDRRRHRRWASSRPDRRWRPGRFPGARA